ncbi:MAG: RNA polymerase subunit sigma-70 [Nevskiales bacterium]|nr:RNA polymerase subunit sigma-70 [Nevskiales bacterium]
MPRYMNDALGVLIEGAKDGDAVALEAVVREVQDKVYRLAIRMLANPDDALEATQEVLITVITKLSTFEGRSSFDTWVYRVAVNYLLDEKKAQVKRACLSFEEFREDLHSDLVSDPTPSDEEGLLLSELRISCTMAMLLCLDLKHRIAYVLGDVFEFDHSEAAEILSISKVNFRQRLSRARSQVVAFTSAHCGVANENAKCSCPRRLPAALNLGRINKERLVYAQNYGASYEDVMNQARAVEKSLRALILQRSIPVLNCPEDLGVMLADIVSG